MAQDNDREFKTGAQLLAEWGCETRESKLECACVALMETIEELHQKREGQPLKESIADQSVTCSCADAYRMGHEAIRR